MVCRSWTKESHCTHRANDLVCRFSDYKDGSSSSSFFWCSTERIMTLGQFQWPGHLKRPNFHSFKPQFYINYLTLRRLQISEKKLFRLKFPMLGPKMNMSIERWRNVLKGENGTTRRKTCTSTTSSTTNIKRPTVFWNKHKNLVCTSWRTQPVPFIKADQLKLC